IYTLNRRIIVSCYSRDMLNELIIRPIKEAYWTTFEKISRDGKRSRCILILLVSLFKYNQKL
ncbi:MAG: hypothetical protein M3250_05975, partial [Thermoproteota archaeon]|nr:hypothetical protein [Thermoproteota archaeon]